MLDAVGARIGGFLDRIDAPFVPAPTPPSERLAVPEQGSPPDEVVARIFDELLPASVHTAGPGYLAYIPGGGLPSAAIGDLIALVLNRFGGFEEMAPALVGAEWAVIRWLASELGLGRSAGGLLLSGSSMANLVAIHTARVAHEAEGDPAAVLYCSDQIHHSVGKALRVLGLPRSACRTLPTGADLRLHAETVREAIREDRASGRRPFAVLTTAGTTNTGAIDDLPGIADLCIDEELWFHVDGAYGGAFALCPEARPLLDGIDRADSIALDPHKGFGLPYGTGALLVRDHATLKAAHGTDAAYLPFDRDAVNFADASPELSREVRGLRLWFPLQLHGAAAFRANLDEKLRLCRLARALLLERPWLREGPSGPLSILLFRVEVGDAPSNGAGDQQRVVAAVNTRGRVHLSGTTVHGIYWIRLAILSFRTHAEHISLAFAEIDHAAAALAPEKILAGAW